MSRVAARSATWRSRSRRTSRDAGYDAGVQRHRFTFNGIWEAPCRYAVERSLHRRRQRLVHPDVGLRRPGTGGTGGRLRQNGTLIERNSFNQPPIHRVDMRVQKRLSLGPKVKVDGIFEMFNVFNRSNFEAFTLNESNARY